MSPDDILVAIKASADLAARARAMPPDTQGIADALSAGRQVRASVPVAILAAWCASSGMRATIQDASQNAQSPLRSSALTLLDVLHGAASSLDFGASAMGGGNVGMLDAWVTAGAMTSAQRDEVLALAMVADPVAEFDVRRAIFADDGSLKV